MSKKAAYTVTGFGMMDPEMLLPHPAAMIPIDDEDAASIERSIDAHSILHPLLVSEQPDKRGMHAIFDGVNRWRTATQLGLEEVPCLLVDCRDPAMIVAECLSAGRKRTTGQRILVYLEAHKDAVLEAREMGKAVAKGGADNFKHRQQNAGVSFETPEASDYSIEGISTLLKCSKPDVVSALEIFEALHTETVPDNLSNGKRSHTADEDELAMLREQRDAVLSGHSPVRAWKRAFFGRASTKDAARAPIDYPNIMDRSLTGLLTALPRWAEFRHCDRAIFEEKFAKVLNALPDDLKVLLK
jgi:ParB-like chromosome segregation protein Spo0J